MSALSDLVKYAQMGDVIYKRGEHNQPYSRANEAAAELERLQAIAYIANFIATNKRNFTVGDIDGVASRTIDQLAALLDRKP
jgi:hypothetical protein